MAHEVGTATDFVDLFNRIVSFLTTNQDLVNAGREWEVLRIRRDNLESYSTNLAEPSDVTYRKMSHTFRYDPRTLNIEQKDSHNYSNFYASWTTGAHSTWKLRQAREVTKVHIKAPSYSSYLNSTPKTFRIQYSDNGSAWTTADTFTASPSFTIAETRLFSISGNPGAHLYWRILWDATQTQASSGSISWNEVMLLEYDGTVANHYGSEVLFKAKGNAGTDQIYTGIRTEYDETAGWYNLFMNGYSGFDPNVESWFEQPGALPGYGVQYPLSVPMVPCWNTQMPYWLAASGRSFRFSVKVGTSYEAGYLGFILPYSTPSQFPYPLAVGGSLVPNRGSRSANWRYSVVSGYHGTYRAPGSSSTSGATDNVDCALYLRNPDGLWVGYRNRTSNSANPEAIVTMSTDYSSGPSGSYRSVWPHCQTVTTTVETTAQLAYRNVIGGGYIMQPCILLQRLPTKMVAGELEGTFSISGYQNSAENTTVFDGKTHVIFQDTYRNTVHEHWALSLD